MISTSIYDFPDTTIIMGLHYFPGFQADLTSWIVTIDERSRLTQTLQTVEALPKSLVVQSSSLMTSWSWSG